MLASPQILALHEPTRGVDIGARDQIHQRLIDYATGGATVIVITSDVDEAIALANRLIVMRDGSIAAELTGAGITASKTLAVAAGFGADT